MSAPHVVATAGASNAQRMEARSQQTLREISSPFSPERTDSEHAAQPAQRPSTQPGAPRERSATPRGRSLTPAQPPPVPTASAAPLPLRSAPPSPADDDTCGRNRRRWSRQSLFAHRTARAREPFRGGRAAGARRRVQPAPASRSKGTPANSAQTNPKQRALSRQQMARASSCPATAVAARNKARSAQQALRRLRLSKEPRRSAR